MAKKKVALSYGHGANTYEDARSKFVIVKGKVYEEHTFNATVGEKVNKILKDHGVETLVVQPPMGKDVPLKTRTDKANAWGADIYWSIHANAGVASARGFAGFYWSTAKDSKKLADTFAKHLKEAKIPLYAGGTYASVKGTWTDFHEVRETKMTALLTENGFMTNEEDFKLIFLNEGGFHDKLAVVHAKAILEFLGIKYKGTTKKEEAPKPVESKPAPKKDIYRVIVDGKQVGAFGESGNVYDAVNEAIKDGANKVIVEKV